MPVYREREDWLRDAITSVRRQTFKDWELLVVLDDPTNVKLAALVRGEAKKDRRISFLKNDKNIGRAASRNRAVHEARGTFIAILDADDVAEPGRLAEQTRFMAAHPDVDLLFSWATFIDGEGKQTRRFEPEPALLKRLQEHFFTTDLFIHSSLFMKADLLRALQYDPAFKRSQDFEMWLRAYAQHKRFALLPKRLVRYRVPSHDNFPERVSKQRMFLRYASRLFLKHLPSFAGNPWYWSRLVRTLGFCLALHITPRPFLIAALKRKTKEKR